MQLDLLNGKITLEEFVDNREWTFLIRTFRGFRKFGDYINLKDFVYLQGLYKITFYKYKITNIFNLCFRGVINEDYIKKYRIAGKTDFDVIDFFEQSSAYYILKKVLKI